MPQHVCQLVQRGKYVQQQQQPVQQRVAHTQQYLNVHKHIPQQLCQQNIQKHARHVVYHSDTT